MNLQATAQAANKARWAPNLQDSTGTVLTLKQTGSRLPYTLIVATNGVARLVTSFHAVSNAVLMGMAEAYEVVTIAGMVTAIRTAFDLNVKQMAELLGVERVTIYAWMRGEQSSLRAPNRKRLHGLHLLAKEWSKLEPLAGDYLHEPVGQDGKTLWAHLQDPDLQSTQLQDVYRALTSAASPIRRRHAHQKAQAAALSRGFKKVLTDPSAYGLDLD